MVERDVLAPAFDAVTLRAVRAELAGVDVPRAVARHAIRAEFLGRDRRRVARVAAELAVRADQRELPVARVIESDLPSADG